MARPPAARRGFWPMPAPWSLVVAPRLGPEMAALAEAGRVEHRPKPFAPNDLDGQTLVIAATGVARRRCGRFRGGAGPRPAGQRRRRAGAQQLHHAGAGSPRSRHGGDLHRRRRAGAGPRHPREAGGAAAGEPRPAGPLCRRLPQRGQGDPRQRERAPPVLGALLRRPHRRRRSRRRRTLGARADARRRQPPAGRGRRRRQRRPGGRGSGRPGAADAPRRPAAGGGRRHRPRPAGGPGDPRPRQAGRDPDRRRQTQGRGGEEPGARSTRCCSPRRAPATGSSG